MGSKDVTNVIKVDPSEVVSVKPNSSVEVTIENTGKKTVAYKLKTTRPASVKPQKTFGMLKKGEKNKVKFQFKPKKDEKPFLSEDRITIVVSYMPEKITSPEKFWKSANAMAEAKKVVLKLEKAGEKSAPKKKKVAAKEEKEEEEEVASEESEAEETEGETASET